MNMPELVVVVWEEVEAVEVSHTAEVVNALDNNLTTSSIPGRSRGSFLTHLSATLTNAAATSKGYTSIKHVSINPLTSSFPSSTIRGSKTSDNDRTRSLPHKKPASLPLRISTKKIPNA
ncbi:hypothetical protein V2J09_016626 [Rumex salicifolius]